MRSGNSRNDRTPTAAPKIVGYVRVSTCQQVEDGVSLDAQRARLRAYCAALDLDLRDIIADEGVSASTLKRPGLQRALHMLEAGKAETLLVFKLDRLTRSIRDLGDLVERYFASGRCALLSVSDSIDTRSAAGRMVMNLITVVSQWEREAIGERTREAMAQLRAEGADLGGAPYGKRLGPPDARGRRRFEPDPTQQAVLRRILDEHAAGVDVATITAQLNADGVPAMRRGSKWYRQTLYNLLKREGRLPPKLRRQRPRLIPARTVPVYNRERCLSIAQVLRGESLSLRRIGAALEKHGLVTPKGMRQWSSSSVAILLGYRRL